MQTSGSDMLVSKMRDMTMPSSVQPAAEDRPRLKLLPKGSVGNVSGPAVATKASVDPFGGAKPRELNVSQEREMRYREKEALIDFERQAAIEQRKEAAAKAAAATTPYRASSVGLAPGTRRSQPSGDMTAPYPPSQRTSFGNPTAGPMPQQRFVDSQDRRQRRTDRPGEGYVCKICGEQGHWIKECPQFVPRASAGRHPDSDLHGQNDQPFFDKGARSGGFSQHEHYQRDHDGGNYPDSIDQRSSTHYGSGMRSSFTEVAPRQGRNMSRGSVPDNYVCRICNVPGHWIQDCRQKQQQNNPHGMAQGSAAHHNGYGSRSALDHQSIYDMHQDDRSLHGFSQSQSQYHQQQPRSGMQTRESGGIPPAGYLCKICSIPGHFITDCPDYRQTPPSQKTVA